VRRQKSAITQAVGQALQFIAHDSKKGQSKGKLGLRHGVAEIALSPGFRLNRREFHNWRTCDFLLS
jgi:hypothetical protein